MEEQLLFSYCRLMLLLVSLMKPSTKLTPMQEQTIVCSQDLSMLQALVT